MASRQQVRHRQKHFGDVKMKTTTTETLAGRLVEDALGVVRGQVLWARRIMKYNHGGLRGLNYSSMDEISDGLQKAREDAEAKAKAQAKAMGGDAIICMKLEITELTDGLFQAVATGTAVRTSAMPQAMPILAAAANDDVEEDVFSTIPVMEKPALRLVSNCLH
jgi:uncharacterized protein YbjQ (UPF0145 family)